MVNQSNRDTIWVHFQHSIRAKIWSRKLLIFASSFIGHAHHYPVTSSEIYQFSIVIILVLLFLLRSLYLISANCQALDSSCTNSDL